jgi:hypothetical protein
VLEAAEQRDRVADAERVAVDQAHDVARVGDVERAALLRDHRVRARQADVLVQAVVVHDEISPEAARADAHEGQAVAVALVHVGLDLEHVGAEGRSTGSSSASPPPSRSTRRGSGRRREIDEGVEEGLDCRSSSAPSRRRSA